MTTTTGTMIPQSQDFFRSGSLTGLTPDGATDVQDAIFRSGQVVIDTGTVADSGLTLDDLRSTYVSTSNQNTTTENQNTATGVNVAGKVVLANSVGVPDVRATNLVPQDYGPGVSFTFKQAATIGITTAVINALSIVGNAQTYANLETDRRYGNTTDLTGGPVFQRVTLDSGARIYRQSTSPTTWGPWTLETVCPAPMTRAALMALRTAGQLNTACHYIINDFVQGRFLAGTRVFLHANSPSELSMVGHLDTLFDNSAWTCTYDIDNNNLLRVEDNLGNIAEAFTTGRVASYDWGNVAWINNRLSGAITFTPGATASFFNNVVGHGSVLNMVGRTGNVERTTINGGATVDLTNSNCGLSRCEITTASSLNMNGYSGGSALTALRVSQGATVNASGTTQAVTLTNVEVSGGASILSANVTTAGATLSMTNTTVSNQGAITRSASVSPATINGCRIFGTATSLNLLNGSFTATGSEFGPFARVIMNGAGTVGAVAFGYGKIDTVSVLQWFGAGTLNATGVRISGASSINSAAGSNTNTTLTYCVLEQTANITIAATSTAGTFGTSYTSLTSGGSIGKSGVANLSVYYCNITSRGAVLQAAGSNRSLSVQRTGIASNSFVQTYAAATGGAGVVDQVFIGNIASGASIRFQSTGAAPNLSQYDMLQGIQAVMVFTGTNGGITTSLNVLLNGTMTFTNNTVAIPTVLMNEIRSGSTMLVSGCTAAPAISYNTADNASAINITNMTAASIIQRNRVANVSGINVSGASTFTSNVDVDTGSAFNQPGGSSQRIKLSMGGTLNTGNFTHSGIIYMNNTVQTLTANNTNRTRIMNVTSALPTI